MSDEKAKAAAAAKAKAQALLKLKEREQKAQEEKEKKAVTNKLNAEEALNKDLEAEATEVNNDSVSSANLADEKAKAAAAAKAKAAAAAKAKAAAQAKSADSEGSDDAAGDAKAKAIAAAKAKAAAAAKAKAAAQAKSAGTEGTGDAAGDAKAKAIAAAKAKAAAVAAAKKKAAGSATSDELEAEKPSHNQPLLDKYLQIIKANLDEDLLEDAYINRAAKHVPTIVVKREHYFKVAQFLKHNEQLAFDYLSTSHAIDYQTHMEVYNHFYSFKTNENIAMKVKIDRENPEIESLVSIWDGANWPEREMYDLFGIVFTGHPNLTRILLPDDWVGHPLRKDYEPHDEGV